MMIYGAPDDPEWEADQRRLTFDYLKAKIEAEKLNPEDDFDGDRKLGLMKDIAMSDCDLWQRRELVNILTMHDNDD